MVKVLNRLDASLKVNEGLTQQVKSLSEENSLLVYALEKEKLNKQDIVEASLVFEKDTESEKLLLKTILKL